ncbi:MAG TPA: TlpA disulfide reductase family protein [Polyangia bacterium]|nr:TlpA disulfide reductase family protein [Polyangia bacterium]
MSEGQPTGAPPTGERPRVNVSRWVGRAILLALFVIFALRVWSLRGQGLLHPATPRGSLAPDVAGPLLVGDRFRLSAERGHPVALVFWAPWCGPCRAELPGVERVAQALKASPHTARVIAVDTEGDRDNALEAAAKLGLTLPIMLDDGRASSAYQVTMIPQTVIIDRDGRIAQLLRGGTSEDALMRAIEKVENP